MCSFWYIDAFKRFDSVTKATTEFLNKITRLKTIQRLPSMGNVL